MFRIKEEHDINVVCHGCLSSNRKLIALKTHADLFFMLLGQQKTEDGLEYPNVFLCWECAALLHKTRVFQHRIRQAQFTLHNVASHFATMQMKSLSKLTFTKNESINFNENEEERISSILIEPEKIELEVPEVGLYDVKIEPDDDTNHYSEGDICTEEYKPENVQVKKEKVKNKKYKNKKLRPIRNEIVKKTDNDLSDLDSLYTLVSVEMDEVELFVKTERGKQSLKRFPYKCNYCKEHFRLEMDLKRHKDFRHLQNSFKCSFCGEEQQSQAALNSHWVSHNAFVRCNLCQSVHRNPMEARQHITRRHANIYTCTLCNIDFDIFSDFHAHFKAIHYQCICDDCGKSFSNKKTIAAHISRAHMNAYCNICKKEYRNYKSLKCHLKMYHPWVLNKQPLKSELSYCVECDIQFQSVGRFKKHLADTVAHNAALRVKKTIPCPECGKIFSRICYMKNHLQLLHRKASKHRCHICGKSFTNGFGLRNHIKFVHEKAEKERNKICDICGRGFHTSRTLKNHRMTHTGERPHKCRYCPAAFTQLYAMQTHEKTQHKCERR